MKQPVISMAAEAQTRPKERAIVNSKIYVGHVMHERGGAGAHSFQYPVYVYAIDLDELEAFGPEPGFFSHNRRNIVSLFDADYLSGEGSLRERLGRLLKERGIDHLVRKVTLVTAARYFNYVFNPVSFYYCRDAKGALLCAVAEVNNTFGERHLYVLERPQAEEGGFLGRATQPKDFHVSPFNDMAGDYDFYFSELGEKMDIRINVLKGGKPAFRSRIWGQARPLNRAQLAKTLLQFPLSAALTMPRILWQAAKLRYQKRLPVYSKPYASSAMTIRAEAPSSLQKLSMSLVFSFMQSLQRGRLTITLPDRSQKVFGKGGGTQAEMTIGNYAFFRRVILGGDIGLGESYQEGEWSSPDLTAVIKMLGENMEHADDRSLSLASLGRLANRFKHLARSNTLSGSKKNIQAHYDLSKDLYALYLDKTWMYSGAIFARKNEGLETAQRRKIKGILDKAKLEKGMSILEIGSGWGSLAIEAAKNTAAAVTSLTLSHEYCAWPASVPRRPESAT